MSVSFFSENGIIFTYHPHGYEFQPYGDGTLMDYIIENTDPRYVSFEMDIFWVQFGGADPAALLRKYGNRWKLMHLKDMKKGTTKDLTGGTSVENNVPVGFWRIRYARYNQSGKQSGNCSLFYRR